MPSFIVINVVMEIIPGTYTILEANFLAENNTIWIIMISWKSKHTWCRGCIESLKKWFTKRPKSGRKAMQKTHYQQFNLCVLSVYLCALCVKRSYETAPTLFSALLFNPYNFRFFERAQSCFIYHSSGILPFLIYPCIDFV